MPICRSIGLETVQVQAAAILGGFRGEGQEKVGLLENAIAFWRNNFATCKCCSAV